MAGARPAPEAAGAAPEAIRALRMAAARVGGAVAALGLEVTGCSGKRVGADRAFDDIDQTALCLLVDPPGGAGTGAPDPASTGVLALSPGLVDALVEVQTLGRIDGPARPARRPTRIDAALAHPFARDLVAQLAARISPGDPAQPVPGALRPGTFVAGPGPLPTILSAPRMLRLDLALSLGHGAREARVVLILPQRAAPVAGAERDPASAEAWRRSVDTVMPTVPVRLEAVIEGGRLPLGRLLALRPGDVLDLPEDALSAVTLHGGAIGLTLPGRRRLPRGATCAARLGQLGGRRAVKLTALPGDARSVRDAVGRRPPSQTDVGSAGLPDLAPTPAEPDGDEAAAKAGEAVQVAHDGVSASALVARGGAA